MQVGVILGMYKNVNSVRRISLSPHAFARNHSMDFHQHLPPHSFHSWPTLDSPDECRVGDVSSPKSDESNLGASTPQSAPVTMDNSERSIRTTILDQPRSIYTAFVSTLTARSLRRKGMRKVLQRLESVCTKTVSKVVAMLQRSPVTYAEAARSSKKPRIVDFGV
ncbi:unnamed protein product, partial [Gongylonema pulchrum]|uniref:TAFII28 domain-containing protein n=1 Tax=Gongylonema pulchrum TaxID=637853 RepID=A0A183D6R0_9BILA